MHERGETRRDFVTGLVAFAGAGLAARSLGNPLATDDRIDRAADVTLRIAPVQIEIAKGCIINTTGYNGSVPGPIIRLQEGVPATVDLFNDTATPEYVHWHGQNIPAELDGAEEEGSLMVPQHGHLRYVLTPYPSGSRYVHTHAMSMSDVTRGGFNGQFAFTYIEPKNNPGAYDLEVFLATHEWEPHLTSMEQHEDTSAEDPATSTTDMSHGSAGLEVAYRYFTINGKCLGHGDPVRVKQGQRVLFRFLNASATESVRLALPGHQFQIVALDGNPVPQPQLVDVLELATAERIDALVEMSNPGIWILGTPMDSHRRKGMGIVVEYANERGRARWIKPTPKPWDYAAFGAYRPPTQAAESIPLVFERISPGNDGFERWTLNGRSFDAANQPRQLTRGRCYRLIFDNRSDDRHPVHLHRSSFEVVKVGDRATGGLMKDVVVVDGRSKVEVEVTPSLEGPMLFHCHQQLHMDHGFKILFNVS